jgi:hypothetical protein
VTRAALAAALLLVGCSSAAPDSAPSDEPAIKITQLSSVGTAARNVTGSLLVHYRVDVTNTSHDPITLKHIDVQSIGYGAYSLSPVTQAFDVPIAPGDSRFVEVWAPAFIDNASITGANGPVTLRVTAHYVTPNGMKQAISVQQVHASPTGD